MNIRPVLATLALLATAACSAGNTPTTPASSLSPAPVIPASTPAVIQDAGILAREAAAMERMRRELPHLFTGCPGQGSEKRMADMEPNVKAYGIIQFISISEKYPHGYFLRPYDGLNFTEEHKKHPGQIDSIINWSFTNPDVKTYMIAQQTRSSVSTNVWTWGGLWPQTGMDLTTTSTINDRSLLNNLWVIIGYDPSDRCSGKTHHAYQDINWFQIYGPMGATK